MVVESPMAIVVAHSKHTGHGADNSKNTDTSTGQSGDIYIAHAGCCILRMRSNWDLGQHLGTRCSEFLLEIAVSTCRLVSVTRLEIV